jgi:hypothetical protein
MAYLIAIPDRARLPTGRPQPRHILSLSARFLPGTWYVDAGDHHRAVTFIAHPGRIRGQLVAAGSA